MADDARPVLQLDGNLIAFDLDSVDEPRVLLFCPSCLDETSVTLETVAGATVHPFPCEHPPARLSKHAVELLLRLLTEMRHLSGALPERAERQPHERFERRQRG